jgi:hypothetical protein
VQKSKMHYQSDKVDVKVSNFNVQIGVKVANFSQIRESQSVKFEMSKA